ncbi:MAG: hypothetical protein DI619_05555, partial [Francisella sp.]
MPPVRRSLPSPPSAQADGADETAPSMYGDESQSASDAIAHHPPLPSPPAALQAEVTPQMPEPEADAPPNAPESDAQTLRPDTPQLSAPTPDAQTPRPDTPQLSAPTPDAQTPRPDAPQLSAPTPALHAAPTEALEPAPREHETTPLARAKSLQVPSAPPEARPVRARSLLLASLQRADERSRTPPPAPAPVERPAPEPTPPPAARPPLANVENQAPASAMTPTSGLRARAQKYLQTVEKTSTDARASDPSPAATSSSAENQPPKPMYPPSALSESLRRRMA